MPASPSLHVTIASTQKLWHGGEKQAALLASGLRDRGHVVTILARRDGLFCQGMSERGFEVGTLSGRGRSPGTMLRCRRYLRQWKPDVVLANDGHALTAIGFSSLGLTIPLRVAARRVDFPIRSRAKFTRFANGIICVSNAVADVCRQSGIDESLLHVVHDGVPTDFAESGVRSRGRESLRIDDKTKLLLVVSKLTDHKGHRFLLDAMPSILAADSNILLALAGDGELAVELKRQATALDIAGRVRFLGYRKDVPDLLAAADVVVQPSHLEGLCSSLIDAMLAARPIVATRAGGIPDLLQVAKDEEQVAWLVPPRCPDALAAAVSEALREPAVAARRSQAARRRALARFTDDMMVDRTLAVFAELFAAREQRRAA